MSLEPRSFLLTDLSWVEIRAHLARDSRLLVPVGACDQYGPHLPLGAATLVAEAVARELSRDFGVLRAPAIPYGVNVPSERRFAGTASVREKTLHGLLNDLLASWEDHGFTEFVLITAHGHDAHVEAVATVSGTHGRVRVLEVLGIDFSDFLEGEPAPQHGGEVLTSLMLYLHPDKVNQDRIEDFPPAPAKGGAGAYRLSRIPATSLGSIGRPSLASREKGRRIFDHMVQKIRSKVFLDPPDDD